jgi:hypothetical protein
LSHWQLIATLVSELKRALPLRYTSSVPDASPTSLPDGSSDRSNIPPDDSFSTRLKLFNYSGIFFAILQSACSAFIALSGVRLLIGVGAFAFAAGALRFADRVHLDAIRIPMMFLALVGSVLNLLALRRVWSLRRRTASAWRQRPVPKGKNRAERLQFTISVLTILILIVETAAHHHLFHHL